MLRTRIFSLLISCFTLCIPPTQAFVVVSRATTLSTVERKATPEHHDNFQPSIQPTEHLLIEAAKRRDLGLKQEYGITVKKDGLDHLRAFVWGLFEVSQVVFGALAVLLTCGLLLNILGYGYFFTPDGKFVIDSLEHIRQEHVWQLEAMRLGSGP